MSIIIDKIKFQNYRQYGTGSLSFRSNSDSKLSVLIAKNGTGKTTFLNAITWCLYGKEMHLTDEKTALPIVNTAIARSFSEGSFIPVSVTLTIHDGDNIVEFHRTVNAIRYKPSNNTTTEPNYYHAAPKLTVSITPTGSFSNTKVIQGPDADVIVKQYFDEAIFKFYFFDGEKLSDFFAAGDADTIQESIFNISQVTMLDNALKHLSKIRYEHTKQVSKKSPNIELLNSKRENLEIQLGYAKKILNEKQAEVADLTKRRKELEGALRTYAPIAELQKERQSLEKELEKCEQEEERHRSARSRFIRQYYILLTLYPRIAYSLRIIHHKELAGDMPPAIDKDQVRRLLDNLDQPCPICNNTIGETGRKHLEELLEKISLSSHTSNYLSVIKGPLENYVEQAKLFKRNLDELRQREIDIEANKNKITKRLQEINSSLSTFASEDDHLNVVAKENERTRIIEQINLANQSIGNARANSANFNKELTEIKKEIHNATQSMSKDDILKNQLKVIHFL